MNHSIICFLIFANSFLNMNWGMDNKEKLSGAYFGEIEKDQVGIIISANNGIIIGTLFFGSEKYSFLGTLNRSKVIEPNVIIDSKDLELELKFENDEIGITSMKTNNELKYSLKKVSNNLAYDFSKEFGGSILLDPMVIGTWKMVASFKNEIEFPSKEAKGNYKSSYLDDGQYLGDIRTQSEMKKLGLNINISFKWYTKGNSLIIEPYGNPALPSISYQTDYEIRNDTLITRINEFKYIFIKYRSID